VSTIDAGLSTLHLSKIKDTGIASKCFLTLGFTLVVLECQPFSVRSIYFLKTSVGNSAVYSHELATAETTA